jgi:putative flippase GtrA
VSLNYRQPLRFALAGVAGFLVDAGTLYLASFAGLGYFAGRAISFLCAVWVTWRINRRYTFAAADCKQTAWSEWWSYLTAMSAGGTLNYAAYSVAILCLPASGTRPLAAVAIGSLAGMVLNYATAKIWVFRSR